MNFIKFHGFGNDYIIFEEKHLVDIGSINDFVRKVCDRHYGAGADGIVTIRPSEHDDADWSARIFNVDGSEAQLSGNGTRCAVSYLHYKGLWNDEVVRLKTLSGVKRYRLIETIAPGSYWFEAELGKPAFDSASIPMDTGDEHRRISNYPLEVDGQTFRITAVQTGNPHCVIFVDDFDSIDWRSLGRLIETHPQFPQRTNVEFVKILDRGNIEIRIWERGVGETLSSGTCSCGSAIASMVNDRTDRRVRVQTEGGAIEVEWREDEEIVMTGRADIVYAGQWLANE